LDWDEGPVYQSSRLPLYHSAIQKLLDGEFAYPCVCSRKEVEAAASAPHLEDGAAIYPGTCRGRYATIDAARADCGRAPAIRFKVPDGTISFHDGFAGPQSFEPASQLGDFVVSKADGTPAYQLAVVVDDADMRVTRVVRAADLIDSTPRQILLYRALGLAERIPHYYHLPLVVGPDGRRLAKRHGDTRLSYYRDRGVPAARVIDLLARWCGLENMESAHRPADLLQSFRLESLPKHPIVFTPEEDAWLLANP
jgi:glutamyl-tRNA synthetase